MDFGLAKNLFFQALFFFLDKRTWFNVVELFLDGLLCGGQHQVTDIQDFHCGHGVLVYLHFRFCPVYSDCVTPQLNSPYRDRGRDRKQVRVLDPLVNELKHL